ncbi:MAG: ribose-phosphate pyrophosphokinase [Coriobacteriia bacterium]|nr:ribose-phosphate pyrophosphokinase [Coriobacteriia bacterium]
MRRLMLFSGTTNPWIASEIADELDIELSKINIHPFANGEIYVRYLESVRGADVFLVQSLSAPVNEALMELLIMIDAAKRASAARIVCVIPHYAYARQDKKSASREPITARLVADLLTAAGADAIMTMDLHTGSIQGFFDLPVNHLTALGVLADYFKGLQRDGVIEDMIVVSPDVGRAKASKKLSELLGCHLAIMHKVRPEHNEAEISHVIGKVEGKTCVVVDDMIDTGGTICNGAEALMKKGAKAVYLGATHGILSDPAFERLGAAPIVECVVTNTIAVDSKRAEANNIKVLSVAPMFARAIKNVHELGSVSELFDPDFQL